MAPLINIPGILKIEVKIGLEHLKCGKSGCMGYMNDDEFEFKFQTENRLKEVESKEVMQVDKLPWPEVFVGDLSSEYEVIRAEMMTDFKKLASLNGRFVVMFKAKCGCPYAKFEVWSSEDCRRRHATASIVERIKSGEEAARHLN